MTPSRILRSGMWGAEMVAEDTTETAEQRWRRRELPAWARNLLYGVEALCTVVLAWLMLALILAATAPDWRLQDWSNAGQASAFLVGFAALIVAIWAVMVTQRIALNIERLSVRSARAEADRHYFDQWQDINSAGFAGGPTIPFLIDVDNQIRYHLGGYRRSRQAGASARGSAFPKRWWPGNGWRCWWSNQLTPRA